MCMAITHEYTIRLEDEIRGSRTFGMNRDPRGAGERVGPQGGQRGGQFGGPGGQGGRPGQGRGPGGAGGRQAQLEDPVVELLKWMQIKMVKLLSLKLPKESVNDVAMNLVKNVFSECSTFLMKIRTA